VKSRLILLLLFSASTILHFSAQAAVEFPAKARFFLGSASIKPVQLNDALSADGMEKFNYLPSYGFEITTKLYKFIDYGFRYTKHSTSVEENPPVPSTWHKVEIDQDCVQFVLRANILTGKVIRADLFGAVGGNNMTLTFDTSTQSGELTKKANYIGGLGSFMSTYGATIGIGYNWLHLMIEGGFENNKINNLDRYGTVPQNIRDLDLSNGYVLVGFMLDGVTATRD
jgi:hypothetical protein